MSLFQKTATELSGMLKSKQISAAELINDVFARIDAVEDKVQAYITQTRALALSQAEKVDERRQKGEDMPMLSGIPLAVKDNIGVKGIPLTCASKMLQSYIPPFSATVIDVLADNGTIITGKTNLNEFAMGSSGETSYFKMTRNPQNLDHVPGGSSGGSAAAIAAGEAVISLGTDTGGSARLPASYCGVVGLRPTYGAVSRYGAVAFASSLDQICPMGRSVADVSALFSEICGPDKMDATTANRGYLDFTASLDGEINGMIIGIPAEYFSDAIDADVAKLVMDAVRVLEREGAVIKQISLPSTGYALPAYFIISAAEASSNLARFDGVRFGHRANEYVNVDELIEKSRGEGFGDEIKRRLMLGTHFLSAGYYDKYYKRAALMRRRIQAEFEAVYQDCDCIVSPTAATTAAKLDENMDDPAKRYSADSCTVAVSLAGLPAISVPCGTALDGLPVGLQIIGKRFSEEQVLKMAYRFETATGGPKSLSVINQ
ncbi:MAG: Asp-tRNA(Asn)/Glu-tRNA(Gln) amidotransferase subunit GatA [Oscillospiraceae bacterium]|nr:Asp-tRNA(Asn)/Glu-tRNA(Gln) amidotransferase subunit GatA [Oscillospiraceae bacterium]